MPRTVTLFGYGKGIIHLNSEVTDGALDLSSDRARLQARRLPVRP